MSAPQPEWALQLSNQPGPVITLPRTSGKHCFQGGPHGFICTRSFAHTGRHAACGTQRQVLAVWR